MMYWSDPLFASSTQSPVFDPSYCQQVIPTPVRLPKLHDFSKYHEAFVTGRKLQEMYQIIFYLP